MLARRRRAALKGERYYVTHRLKGALVFSAMAGSVFAAVAVSVVMIFAAFLGDGRGRHLVEVLRGGGRRSLGLDAFDAHVRDANDWRLVGVLDQDAPSHELASH